MFVINRGIKHVFTLSKPQRGTVLTFYTIVFKIVGAHPYDL